MVQVNLMKKDFVKIYTNIEKKIWKKKDIMGEILWKKNILQKEKIKINFLLRIFATFYEKKIFTSYIMSYGVWSF